MSEWKLSPSARIELDCGPVLALENAQSTIYQRLEDAAGIEAIYYLASLTSDDLHSFVERALSQNDHAVKTLINNGLLVPGPPSSPQSRPVDAFRLDSFAQMHEFSLTKTACVRDVVTIFDDIFPESTRSSIDIWSRTLSYNRLDIDHPDSDHLHWIHVLRPGALHVQALPFLRILDTVVRRHCAASLKVMRTYVYAGQPNDIYRTHADSNHADDITAIYYPTRWQDHWGGDLVFYDDNEPRWAVSPRGNRFILFHGACPHRIEPVSMAAKSARCSLVLRYAGL